MNSNVDLNKIIYGGDASEKITLLKNKLLVVEQKHIEYFTKRQSRLNSDEFDRLHNHYITITDSSGIKFGFIVESDLEDSIKIECIDIFNKVFNSNN